MKFSSIILTALVVISGIILAIVKRSLKPIAIGLILGALLVGGPIIFLGDEGVGSANFQFSSESQSKITQLETDIEKMGQDLKDFFKTGSDGNGSMLEPS